MNGTNIVVCTVTYNSSVLLKKMIDAVLSQSIPVSHIVVADNNSTEEHKEHLREYAEQFEKVDIVWLDKNTGGAGGFYSSMNYAKEKYAPDWYWLMDDDAYPDGDCLAKLLKTGETLDNIGFLAPLIYGIDKKQYQLYHARIKAGYIYKFNAISDDVCKLEDIECIDVDAFVGPLIPSSVVKKIGLPRPEYFIEGDDTDYCFRITREHKGYLIKNAHINHKDIAVVSGINPRSWWKQYYGYRNAILFAHYNLKGFHKVLSILHVILFVWRERLRMYWNPEYKDYRGFRWRLLRRAIADGITRKGGARLLPSDYFQMLELWEKRGKQ